jgi:hypothetical protein
MESNTQISQPTREPYHAPSLVQYGDIRTLTQNAGMTGNNSDNGKANDKTH